MQRSTISRVHCCTATSSTTDHWSSPPSSGAPECYPPNPPMSFPTTSLPQACVLLSSSISPNSSVGCIRPTLIRTHQYAFYMAATAAFCIDSSVIMSWQAQADALHARMCSPTCCSASRLEAFSPVQTATASIALQQEGKVCAEHMCTPAVTAYCRLAYSQPVVVTAYVIMACGR